MKLTFVPGLMLGALVGLLAGQFFGVEASEVKADIAAHTAVFSTVVSNDVNTDRLVLLDQDLGTFQERLLQELETSKALKPAQIAHIRSASKAAAGELKVYR